MIRKDNWPALFADYLESCRDRKFEWGAFDCALFVCGGVWAITGVDLAAEFRGHYATELGAMRAMRKAGYRTLEQLAEGLAAKFSICEVPVAFAQRGDVVLLRPVSGTAIPAPLGIVSLDGSVVSTGPDGLTAGRLLECAARAWRI